MKQLDCFAVMEPMGPPGNRVGEYYNVVYLAIFQILILQGIIGPPGHPIIIDSGGLMGPSGNMASYHN